MSVSTEFSTALYEDSQQFTSGNLSHFKITFKNRNPDDHMRFAGTLEEGDNLKKGIRYVVINLADDDRNRDYTSIGYLNFFGRYNNGPRIPVSDDFNGLFSTNDNTFIADDGNNMNALYETDIPIPLTKRYSPGDDLEPGTTYTIDVLGGNAGNNPFSTQFTSVDSGDTIAKGFSFKVADDLVGDAGYEGDHFTSADFHTNTRLIKGTTYTKFAYGSVHYENGQIVNNNAMQYVIQKIQNFASIAALGPLTFPNPMTDPVSATIVVVLENWHSDPTSSVSAANQILNQLNAYVDADIKALDSSYVRGSSDAQIKADFEVVPFPLV